MDPDFRVIENDNVLRRIVELIENNQHDEAENLLSQYELNYMEKASL